MNWARMLLLLLIPLITSKSFAQEIEVPEATTTENNVLKEEASSSSQGQAQLDSNLRNALLKALSELEGDDNDQEEIELENDEKNIKRAQASAVTYFANDELQEKVAPTQDQQDQSEKLENQITTTIQETTNNLPNDPKSEENSSEDSENNPKSEKNSSEDSENTPTEKASEVLFQKSDAIESGPITAIEKEPLNFFKDAEQIITSASNSFINQNSEPISSHTPRSVHNDESDPKITSFSNINTITDFESKTPVDEEPFVKTYVRPLGNSANDDVVYVKSSDVGVSSKSSVTSEVKNSKNGVSAVKSKDSENTESTTVAAVEVSTEEHEAKVEQVQFFSAPLVAAFTVHQDEKGQPKKVVPIFKNELNPKKIQSSTEQNVPQQNTNIQSSTFNNLDLQKKQQILEKELEILRKQQLAQQQNIFSRNNIGNNQGFNNLVAGNPSLTQSGFSQAVKQNFNQFDPIFTEPDRSIVTKLATIDPSTLLSQNGGPFLNRFIPSEAILLLNKPGFTNNILSDSKPSLQNSNIKGDVSLIPSISYDPIIQAGRLPLNAQILPKKEPTGFLNFVPLSNPQNQVTRHQVQNPIAPLLGTNFGQNIPNIQQSNLNFVQPNSNLVKPSSDFAKSNFNAFNGNSLAQPQRNVGPNQNLAQPNQNFLQPNSNLIQPSVSNFVSSASQNSGQITQNSNFLNQGVQTGLNPILGATNFQTLNQNNDFLTSNRILRQEQGIGNPGLNQNGISVIKSQQPFNPTHEIGYFPNNRFLGPNQASSVAQPNFVGQNLGFQAQNNFGNGGNQNQNRLFRSNLEGSVSSPNSLNIQQSVQPFGQQLFSNNNLQNNRFFRSNQESSLSAPQNFGNNQLVAFNQSPVDNNRFLRSNQVSTFLSNQNRFSANPTLQNYKYSNSFGFPTIPLNKK